MKASDWEMPVRVVKKDGSYLYGEQGITLDMTEFEVNGRVYAAWSQRQFHPVDQGAWLYIAQLDPEEPWKLISDPVLLSMPEYGWANNHTFVDEGPFALITDKKIFLTFSSAAVDSTYVVGLLSADPDADVIFGTTTDENIENDRVVITIVATGFEKEAANGFAPKQIERDNAIEQERVQVRTIRKISGGYDITFDEDELQVPTYLRRQMD